jgi:hypothetical protein
MDSHLQKVWVIDAGPPPFIIIFYTQFIKL